MQTGLSGNMRNCKYLLEQEYVSHIQESMNDFILLERQESKKGGSLQRELLTTSLRMSKL